jgi:hypothetical protein
VALKPESVDLSADGLEILKPHIDDGIADVCYFVQFSKLFDDGITNHLTGDLGPTGLSHNVLDSFHDSLEHCGGNRPPRTRNAQAGHQLVRIEFFPAPIPFDHEWIREDRTLNRTETVITSCAFASAPNVSLRVVARVYDFRIIGATERALHGTSTVSNATIGRSDSRDRGHRPEV